MRVLQLLRGRRTLERLLRLCQGRLHVGLLGSLHLLAGILQHLLDVVDHAVQLIAGLDLLALLLVLGRVAFRFPGHLLHFFLAQTRAGSDGDARVLTGGVVLRGHVQDAVGVNVERHLDLRNSARRRRQAGQLELAQGAVLPGHGTLALQHMHFHLGLVIGRRREGLRLLGRNGGVARNHGRGHAAQRFNRQGQRCHVQQQKVLDLTGQHARLHGCAHGHHFVGVHAAVRLLAEQLLHQLLNLGHAGLAAHKNYFVNLAGGHAGIGQRLLAGLQRALQQVAYQLLQFGAGQLADQVLGSGCVRGHKRQIDFRLQRGGELDLGLFRGVLQTLQGHLVALRAQVETFLGLELGNEPVHNALVQIVAAQVGIAVGRLDLNHAFAHFKDGDIEGAAAEVVHSDGLVLLLVQAVGQRSRGRLVDDALHVEAGNLAGVLGGLALRVVKVGRNGDDGLGDGLAQISLGALLQLLQNHGRNFGRGVLLALGDNAYVVTLLDNLEGHHLHLVVHFVEAAAHKALDGEDGVLRVGDGLTLGHLADEALSALGEADDGGGGTRALFVGNHFGFAAFKDGYARVGRAKVNSDNLCHGF